MGFWDTYNEVTDPIFDTGEKVWEGIGQGIGDAGDFYNEQGWWLSPNWFKGVGDYYSPAFEVGGPLGQKDSDGDGIPDADEEYGMENWAGEAPNFEPRYEDLLRQSDRQLFLESWNIEQPNALEQFEKLFVGDNLSPLSGEAIYDANDDGFVNELDLYKMDEDYAIEAGAEGYYEAEETAFEDASIGIEKLEKSFEKDMSDLEFIRERGIAEASDSFAGGVAELGTNYAQAWQGLKQEAEQSHIGGLAGAGVEGALSGQQSELSSLYTRGSAEGRSNLRAEIADVESTYEQGAKSLRETFESDIEAQTSLIDKALRDYRGETYDPYYDEYYTEYGYDFEGDKGLWWENPWDTYSQFQLEDDPGRLSAIADASQAAESARQARETKSDTWKDDFQVFASDFAGNRSSWGSNL